MAILHKDLLFADEDAVGTSVGTAIVGDVIDLGARKGAYGKTGNPDIGESGDLEWITRCKGADFAAGASDAPVVTISLVTKADATLSSGATVLCSIVTDKTPNEDDLLGHLKVPRGTVLRYLGVICTIGTAALTAGDIKSQLQVGGDSTVTQKT